MGIDQDWAGSGWDYLCSNDQFNYGMVDGNSPVLSSITSLDNNRFDVVSTSLLFCS